MYHYAMHETRDTKCPVAILKSAEKYKVQVSDAWKKNKYTLENVPQEFSSIPTILSSLRNDMDMGIIEYAELYKKDSLEESPKIDRIVVDFSGIDDYKYDNISVMKQLYKITNGNMSVVKFAFDVLLSLSSTQYAGGKK